MRNIIKGVNEEIREIKKKELYVLSSILYRLVITYKNKKYCLLYLIWIIKIQKYLIKGCVIFIIRSILYL